MSDEQENIISTIWEEESEANDPFAAHACFCHGYDVYGEVLNKARWFEYLYLLFCGERPTQQQSALLEKIAIAIANPGPRDHSIRAAMNAGVGGSNHAAALMAALAAGAGQLGGAHEIALAMQLWESCDQDLKLWQNQIASPPKEERANTWVEAEHTPGFDPYGSECRLPILQTLKVLVANSPGPYLPWLQEHRTKLEAFVGKPLALTGVIAAALKDLQLTPDQAEMLYLLLRLPGAAVHALEQREMGWRRYPFFNNGIELEGDPGPAVDDLGVMEAMSDV